jgi:hypothetical protein
MVQMPNRIVARLGKSATDSQSLGDKPQVNQHNSGYFPKRSLAPLHICCLGLLADRVITSLRICANQQLRRCLCGKVPKRSLGLFAQGGTCVDGCLRTRPAAPLRNRVVTQITFWAVGQLYRWMLAQMIIYSFAICQNLVHWS